MLTSSTTCSHNGVVRVRTRKAAHRAKYFIQIFQRQKLTVDNESAMVSRNAAQLINVNKFARAR